MKIKYVPTDEEVRASRREEYLMTLPVAEQLEALVENAMGRPEKLNALVSKIGNIKKMKPFVKNNKEVS